MPPTTPDEITAIHPSLPSDRPLGVIGLGEMGGAIARRILSQGEPVLGLDSGDSVVLPEARHFERASGVKEIATRCPCVFLVVATDDQMMEVVCGSGGFAEHAAPGSVLVVNSTVRPSTVVEVANHLRARQVDVIDAGMSRGNGSIKDGVLTLFLGGDDHVLDRWLPALSIFSDTHVRCGGLGSGMTVKIANNLMLHANRLAMLEAAALAASAGIDPQVLVHGAAQSTGGSWVLAHWGSRDSRAIAAGNPEDAFTNRTRRELGLAAAIAEAANLDLPLTNLTQHELPRVLTTGMGLAAEAGK